MSDERVISNCEEMESLAAELTEPVTVEMKGVQPATALDAVAEQDVRYERDGFRRWTIVPDDSATTEVSDGGTDEPERIDPGVADPPPQPGQVSPSIRYTKASLRLIGLIAVIWALIQASLLLAEMVGYAVPSNAMQSFVISAVAGIFVMVVWEYKDVIGGVVGG